MGKVLIISKDQAVKLRGKQYAQDLFFNPIQDKNGNWCISEEESLNAKSEYSVLKTAKLIEFVPPDYLDTVEYAKGNIVFIPVTEKPAPVIDPKDKIILPEEEVKPVKPPGEK